VSWDQYFFLSLFLSQVTQQEMEFVKNLGDAQWLVGIEHLPVKIKNLLFFNKILAHQPWFIRTEHVKVRGHGCDCHRG